MVVSTEQEAMDNGHGRSWWQGFAARIMLSTSALSLIVILITSALSYNALREMSLKVANQALLGQARTLRHDMEARVASLTENLKELSSNALIANALADDLGRSVYLRDFIGDISSFEGFEITVAMTNFKGELMAGNRAATQIVMPAEWIAGIIDDAEGSGRVVMSDGVPYLVLAEPIIFRNTGTAEGALVFQVNLQDWLNFAVIKRIFVDEPWISSLTMEAVEDSGDVITQNMNGSGVPYVIAKVFFPPSVEGPSLTLKLSAKESFVQEPLDKLLTNVAAMSGAVFIVALFASFLLSRAQTRKLKRLRHEASRISQGKFKDIAFTSDNCDEVDDLAEAFSTLVDELQKAYLQLEDEAQREIEQRERRFQSIINSSAEGIITISSDGIIETFNPSAERIFGYTGSEVIGKNISMLMPRDERAAHASYLRHSDLHAPKIINRSRDLLGLRKNGTTFALELNVSPMELDGEHKFIGIMRDISERKEFEERINAARIEAEQANLAKSQFLSSMSHELRTPLNAVLGFGQLLELDQKNPLSPSQLKSVGQIIKGGRHLLELIDQVLNLAKIESGNLDLSMEDVDVTPQLEDALAMAQTMADKRKIHIDHEIPKSGTVLVRADSTRLRQILLNLLSNATKYNYEGGSLSLRCRAVDNVCRFEVENTGPGIASHLHDMVFAPFNRLGAEGSTIEGTGIGLTITRELIHVMNGVIGFTSDEGKGALFWFELPLAVQAKASISSDDRVIEKTHTEKAEHKTDYKILYVEDNPSNLELMQMILAPHQHLKLLSAPDAETGLAMVKSDPPDLILMDIQLPGMSGVEALHVLRQDAATATIPVIAVSANAMKSDVEDALQAGFYGYLTKPLDIPNTLATINAALGLS